MTLISSIVARQGILLAADSNELTTGAIIFWKDFIDIITKKEKSEDDADECISPSELKERFSKVLQITRGRIKSTEGAKKIFKINDYCVMQVAGKATIDNKNISEIIDEISLSIENSNVKNADWWSDIAYKILQQYLEKDTTEIAENEYIFSCYERDSKDFSSCKFSFEHEILFGKDGKPIIEDNKHKAGFVFRKSSFNNWFIAGGETIYLREFNNLNVDLKKGEIDLEQAFNLTEKIFELAICIDRIRNEVSGVGGQIRFAVITSDGFKYISSKSDILNI